MTKTPLSPLIVIDLQADMFDGRNQPPIHEADDLIRRTRQLLAWARAAGRPVAFVRHDGPPGDPLEPGAAGWPIWSAIGQEPHEPTFPKTVGDAFSNPDLVAWVTAQGASGVILAGAQSDYCILASTRGGLAQGLAVTVAADAHSTWGTEAETAEAIIRRHNALYRSLGAEFATVADLTAA
ncbi:isochorismatase family protein [Acidisoma sp. 7E03]